MVAEKQSPDVLRENFEKSINLARQSINECKTSTDNTKEIFGSAIRENLNDLTSTTIKVSGVDLPSMIPVFDFGDSVDAIRSIEYDTRIGKLFLVYRENPSPGGSRTFGTNEDNLTELPETGTRQELGTEDYLEFGKRAFDSIKTSTRNTIIKQVKEGKKLKDGKILKETFETAEDLVKQNLDTCESSVASSRRIFGGVVRENLIGSISTIENYGIVVLPTIELNVLSNDLEDNARIVHSVRYYKEEKDLFDVQKRYSDIFFPFNPYATEDKPEEIDKQKLGLEKYIDFGDLLADYLIEIFKNGSLKHPVLVDK